jgi:hypothetical protein
MALASERRIASAPARRQGFARDARQLTLPLTATGASAHTVIRQLLTQLLRSSTTGSNTKFLTTPSSAPFIPPPSTLPAEGYLVMEFYSAATGLSGRFTEGFSLRRSQPKLIHMVSAIPRNAMGKVQRSHLAALFS